MVADSDLPFAIPFIRWADIARITPTRATSLRRIYDHELVYVLAGQGFIDIQAQSFEAKPDRLFFIAPRIWHSYRSAPGEVLDLLGIHFDWTMQRDTLAFPIFSPASEPVEEKKFRVKREIPNWDLNAQPFLEWKGRSGVRRALESVVAEYSLQDENARESAGALLAHAIFLIAREAKLLSQLSQNSSIGADALRRVQRAREILESTQGASQSIEIIAARVGWSGDHLRRMFRQVLQSSPQQVQFEARLRVAQNLLREENLNLPIAEIARRAGFEDASHFARAFKNQTGLTPRQYLRMVKKL